MNKLIEVQVDRIVGPTHHFGGLGVGNLASSKHAGQISYPRAAALEGLAKMRLAVKLGAIQIVLPPQRRPNLGYLGALGFEHDVPELFAKLLSEAPHLLSAASSSSAMWTANAATVSPACDSAFSRTHVTIANLNASLHRVTESTETLVDLQSSLPANFMIGAPLPFAVALSDEGAANHMRLCASSHVNEAPSRGINLFVHGDGPLSPQRFRPRQTLEAFQAIARRHGLYAEDTFYLQQHPAAIDAGAFHNDVVAMSHHDCWIHHESAYVERTNYDAIESRFRSTTGTKIRRISVSQSELPLSEAVRTYLFNSQILTSLDPDGPAHLICPAQVVDSPAASGLVSRWIDEGLFSDVHFVELGQSMAGGGGPACLRLRVPMTLDEARDLDATQLWSLPVDQQLRDIINTHYPESFQLSDLQDSDMIRSIEIATSEIEDLLRPQSHAPD
ncbi:N-succinylarginine dihydrolase [Rubripirellula amarantea]|uniref:N-succinylarginine dihydrolase n=1 Tax=Rubripirellula amarantea TaxID=2527999 RepID=A0A5C5WQ53_9BACT|nr:N-succinylarginine dihydrolase [Rubripirellula amarantea]TWT52828.1 N-succinylarginine dihydrolase [Rubripirellula amarantea]